MSKAEENYYKSKKIMDRVDEHIHNRGSHIFYAENYIEELEEQKKWINVKDRLPDEFSNVLICGSDMTVLFSVFFNNEFNLPSMIKGDFVVAKKMTLWKPLPEPPKMIGE